LSHAASLKRLPFSKTHEYYFTPSEIDMSWFLS
jgi:hypothetical protein